MFRNKIKRDILNGNLLEQMILFFFPAFLGYMLQQIYGIVDSVILGKVVGKAALASVGGSATAIINIILNLVSGITAAITVKVAQNYGRADMEKVQDSVKNGFFISVILGGIVSIIMILLSPSLLGLMNEPSDTIRNSLIYLRIYFISLVPYFIYQTGVSIIRASGDSKRPVYFILLTAVVKIVFDILLAGAFKLGVLGTSLATLLAHLVCAIVVLIIFNYTSDVYHFSLKKFGYDLEILRDILYIGIPFSIQSMLFAIPNTFIQQKINSFGTDAVAAYSAYSTIDGMFWCYANALGTAALTIAGQNYGHGNIKRVKNTAYVTVCLFIIGSIFYGLIFYNFGSTLASFFLTDLNTIDIASRMIKVIACSYIIYGIVESVSAICKAIGNAKAILIIALITICFVRIIYILFVPQITPVYPIFAYPLSWIFASLVSAIYFFNIKKLKQ